MAEAVKGARAYNSPLRRDQAAATRRQILATAQRRFEQEGYVATSMAAIAEEAGVSLKTVYLTFETKSGLLRALWQFVLVGEDDDAPVAMRSWYRQVLDEPDAERQLRLNARNSRVVKERAAALMRVMRDATPSDADLDVLWRTIQSEFHDNQATIVKVLHAHRALRPNLGAKRATDILWTLNHPDVWQLLVVERGWSPKQYEQMVRRHLVRAAPSWLTVPGESFGAPIP
jgi:AcrR family transcriptional regulator